MCTVLVHGTQTHEQTCFFVMKNLMGKMTCGRGEQTSKIGNYQLNEKSQRYAGTFYISKHLKQANNASYNIYVKSRTDC